MSDNNSTIVEKVATLKSAIRDLKQTLQDNNLINGNEQLSDYAITVNTEFANEEINDAILYTTADNPDIWHKYYDYNFINGKISNIQEKDKLDKLIIPASINETNVTTIENEELSGITTLTWISLPNTISSFGLRTFKDATYLRGIKIPSNSQLTCLRVDVFNGCTKLKYFDIPDTITRIEQAAFLGCQSLSYVTFPNNLTYIGPYCFQNCLQLQYISIPVTVETIETNAFLGCSELSCVRIRTSAYTEESDIETLKTKLTAAGINSNVTWIIRQY